MRGVRQSGSRLWPLSSDPRFPLSQAVAYAMVSNRRKRRSNLHPAILGSDSLED